jgi:hypothetical protein
MVDICIHNQPFKHFAKEDQKVVAALKRAWCTKYGSFWIGMMQAWFVWCIKNETAMLVCGTYTYEFQSQCPTSFHGPWVLYLKRFIMKSRYRLSIMIESDIVRASGKRLKLDRERWWSFAFTEVKRIFWVILLRGREVYNLYENRLGWCEQRYMHHLLERVLLGKMLHQQRSWTCDGSVKSEFPRLMI